MPAELTPTEDLIMEVLAARHRLGEPFWPILNSPTTSRAARHLEERGLIIRLHGNTPNTFRARLTTEGITQYTDPEYTPPILQKQDDDA